MLHFEANFHVVLNLLTTSDEADPIEMHPVRLDFGPDTPEPDLAACEPFTCSNRWKQSLANAGW